MDRRRDRASTCRVDRRITSRRGKVRDGGWAALGIAAGPRAVHDVPRLIVSSVRRKARARPSLADSRHPRRAPRKLIKG